MALVGTSVSVLVDFMAAGVHGANELAPPSSGAPSPSVEGWQAPTPLEQNLKRAHHSPTTKVLVAPKDDELTLQVVPLPSDPHEAIAGHSGSSTLMTALQRGPIVPCLISQLASPAKPFKHINLRGSCKMYMCMTCKRTSSNWDSMVSHYLQEHLMVCLTCAQCGMSYSDPSKLIRYTQQVPDRSFTFYNLNINC